MEPLSDEARFHHYNFFPRRCLEQLSATLQSGKPRILVLAGDASAAAFCLAATVHEMATGTEVIPIDPTGREQGTSLASFLQHHVRKGRVGQHAVSRLLDGVEAELKVEKKPIDLPGLVAVSIALKKKLPLSQLLLREPDTEIDDRPPREAASLVLEEATHHSDVILHVTDSLLLNAQERGWLIDEAKRNRRLFIALSCDFTAEDELIPEVAAEWIMLNPLSKQELRMVLDDRCDPNDFDDVLVDALWRYSHGDPQLVARKMRDLVKEGCLDWDETGWRTVGIQEDLSRVFHATMYQSIAELATKLPSSEYGNLERFLQLASLCGEAIPASHLYTFMELGPGSSETLTDIIDDHLVQVEQPVLIDFEYGHEGFGTESLVYQFANPLIVGEIQRRIPEGASQLASALLTFLEDHQRVDTKGKARMAMAVARLAQDGIRLARLHQDLDWWFFDDQVNEFQSGLVRMLRSGSVSPEAIWTAATGNFGWPTRRRLAILSAYGLGPDGVPPDRLLHFLSLKGSLLFSLWRLREAEALHRELLDLHRRVLGPEHPDTLTSMSNLASVLDHLGSYTEAEALLRDALDLHRRVLGPEHPDTLTSMSNLGLVLDHLGSHTEAEPLLRDALDLRRRVLGPEHPKTLTSMNNLASVLDHLGSYTEAEALLRDALDLHRRVLGPEHPDTFTSMSNLAMVLHHLRSYTEAEALLRDALDLHRRVLGPEHPDTLTSMNNLAGVLKDQGGYTEAEALLRDALDLRRRVLGPEHPDTLTSMSNLAGVLKDQGGYTEAEALLRDALDLRRRVLGPEHPKTLTSMNNLASVLDHLGSYTEAEALLRDALDLHRRVLGPEHPDTLTTAEALEDVLHRLT